MNPLNMNRASYKYNIHFDYPEDMVLGLLLLLVHGYRFASFMSLYCILHV